MKGHRRILIGCGLLVALAGTACGGLQLGAGCGGETQHPSGPEDPILQVEAGGFYGPLAWTFRELPSFSLYGDGRLIVPAPRIERYPAPVLQGLTVRRMSEEAVQAILAEACDAGLLGANRDYPGEGMGTDAGTTTFTVNAEGERQVVSVYSFEEHPKYAPWGERGARTRLRDFVSLLSSPEKWLPPGSFGEEEAFTPDRLRIFTTPYELRSGEFLPPLNEDFPEPPPGQLPEVDWPLAESIAAFGEPQDPDQGGTETVRCGVVRGEALEAMLDAAEEASEFSPWLSDGRRYGLVLRPLLPEERGCLAA
jgi:hypothetical protein